MKKFVFQKILTIEIPKSSKLHRYVNKVRKLYHARYKCNNKRDPKIISLNKMLYCLRKLICCLYLAGITENSWLRYLNNMCIQGAWTDALFIQAVAEALNVTKKNK